MQIEELTAQDIVTMSYNELIGIVRETNRPPGGIASISTIAREGFITDRSRVLEIGTSTGFTAIELAKITGANIHAIDINTESLAEAMQRAQKAGVCDNIEFNYMDATNMRYADRSYDVVFCGNVTSLISNKNKALQEYSRVLKDGGMLAAIPMYYVREPSQDLVKRVSDAIQVNIMPVGKKYWTDFFAEKPFQPYFAEDYHFDEIDSAKVGAFSKQLLSGEHLKDLQPAAREALEKTYTSYMHLFRENLAHMGFTIMLLRNEVNPVDAELFTARKV